MPAAVVHGHLVDVLANGRRTFDQEQLDPPAPLLRLLRVGSRYAPRVGGQLDSSGSTAEDLSLAEELMHLVQGVEAKLGEDIDMHAWTTHALAVIERVERPDATLDGLDDLRAFAEGPMLIALERIMDLPAREPTE